MSATTELVKLHLGRNPRTVTTIVEATGKGETTVRKALKELEAAGEAVRDGSTWSLPAPASKSDNTTGDKPAKKKYRRWPTPGTRTTRKNQITGATVGVRNGEEVSKDGDVARSKSDGTVDLEDTDYEGEKWLTVCFTHSTAAGYETVLDAHFASSYPTFCPTCKKGMTKEDIGRRRVKKVVKPAPAPAPKKAASKKGPKDLADLINLR